MRFLLVFLVAAGGGQMGQASASTTQAAQSAAKTTSPSAGNSDPQRLFEQGQAALNSGDLARAEQAFRGVLTLNPQVAGAYANLGVIYMRRKQWQHALEMLHKAERLAPQVAGIRLNVGLVYYRQNDFQEAIAPLNRW